MMSIMQEPNYRLDLNAADPNLEVPKTEEKST